MSIGRDPHQAPKRPDLVWLRRRARPAPPPPPPVPVRRKTPEPAPPPLRPPEPAATPARSPLDLSSPGPSLDLSAPAPAPAPATARAGPRRHRALPVREARRAAGDRPTRLTAAEPTVTLTRLQSGTGGLDLTLTRGPSAGDLAIGCVFQLAGGNEAVVQSLGDVTSGPTGAQLPLVRLRARPDGESLTVDLRQVAGLRRALVYGYSPSIAALSWQGFIVVTTYGGARIEVPLDHPPFSGTMALLTIYNVAGELVLRAEMETFAGPPAMAAEAYDHRLPWLEGRRPLP